jgi:hypothetical protein
MILAGSAYALRLPGISDEYEPLHTYMKTVHENFIVNANDQTRTRKGSEDKKPWANSTLAEMETVYWTPSPLTPPWQRPHIPPPWQWSPMPPPWGGGGGGGGGEELPPLPDPWEPEEDIPDPWEPDDDLPDPWDPPDLPDLPDPSPWPTPPTPTPPSPPLPSVPPTPPLPDIDPGPTPPAPPAPGDDPDDDECKPPGSDYPCFALGSTSYGEECHATGGGTGVQEIFSGSITNCDSTPGGTCERQQCTALGNPPITSCTSGVYLIETGISDLRTEEQIEDGDCPPSSF